MPFRRRPARVVASCLLLGAVIDATALESDRQQPLEVNADATDGTLGDGVTVLRGKVEIRQGSLYVRANEAEVDKVDGKVRLVTLRGMPAYLEQQIEEQGKVQAEAKVITYQVSTGLVTLTGDADVRHPQYMISGDQLIYDLNQQHFQGVGTPDGNGRIRIRLDPEIISDDAGDDAEPTPTETGQDPAADDDAG